MMKSNLLKNIKCSNRSLVRNTNSIAFFGFEKIDESKKKEKVKTVFANVAKKYDLMNDVMSLFIHRLWKDYYVQKLDICKDSMVLDVAGGTGDIAFRFIDRFKTMPNGHGSVTVADINENMLNMGRLKATRLYDPRNRARLHWLHADAESLPFQDNSFDIYTIAFGIRNCTHVDKVLFEAHRVLKPNGIFSCLEFGQVSQPCFRQFYDVYSLQLIPVLGQLLVGDFNSYKYLVESIRTFPNQQKFSKIVEEAQFRNVTYEELSNGVCNIFTGIK